MREAVFDIEADGLWATKVHCLVIREVGGDTFIYRPHEIDEGVRKLETYDRVIAHNGIGYDYTTLMRLHNLSLSRDQMLDSLVLSRVLCGHLKEVDMEVYIASGKTGIPGDIIGRHSIEAWGYRLHKFKGNYAEEMKAKGLDPWANFNEEMLAYCVNDVDVLYELWTTILAPQMGGVRIKTISVPTRIKGETPRMVTDKLTGKLKPEIAECNLTVNVTLPDDAYTNQKGISADFLINAVLNHPAKDPAIKRLTYLQFNGVPEYVNLNAIEKVPSKIKTRPRLSVSYTGQQNDTPTRPRAHPSYYKAALAAGGSSKVYTVVKQSDDTDGAIFDGILSTFHLAPALHGLPPSVLELEHFMAWNMDRLRRSGILFDTAAAKALTADLNARMNQIKKDMTKAFPPTVIIKTVAAKAKIYSVYDTVKEDSTTSRLLQAFAPRTTKKYVYFNVSSRKMVGQHLLNMGWKPSLEDRTPSGGIKCSDDVLGKVEDYFKDKGESEKASIVGRIRLFYLIQKRLGQIANGRQAWLKQIDRNNFLHPTITPCATVTARGAHSNPNVSQVPAIKKVERDGVKLIAFGEEGEWGADCRRLFIVPKGFKQVGADLSGIELRALAHYLTPYDRGAYTYILETTDPHENNEKIIGFANRTDAKRFFFALLYGAGDQKLGSIVMPNASPAQQKVCGKMFRERVGKGIVGFAELVRDIKNEAQRGYIIGLDGRRVPVRAAHSALNTLLQSCGAIVSKVWIEVLLNALDDAGYVYGYDKDYTFLLWSHDEVQFAVREGHETAVAKILTDAALVAGTKLNMKLPIKADAKIGINWLETH